MGFPWINDGASANNPVPNWWDKSELRLIGDQLVYVTVDVGNGCRERREHVTSKSRLIELSAEFDVGDDELGEVLNTLVEP